MEAWTKENSLNPWFSMWTRPRATIQQIVDTDPKRLVLVLAAIAGASEGLDMATNAGEAGVAMELPTVLLFAPVGGALFGVVGLYVSALLISWTGRWIGGQASLVHIRAALAWSRVPVVWVAPLWFPAVALYSRELFTDEMPALDATVGGHPAMALSLLGFYVAGFVAELWSFFTCLKSLGQVQGFSAWKALGNLILMVLVVVLAVFGLVILFLIVFGFLGAALAAAV